MMPTNGSTDDQIYTGLPRRLASHRSPLLYRWNSRYSPDWVMRLSVFLKHDDAHNRGDRHKSRKQENTDDRQSFSEMHLQLPDKRDRH